MVTEFDVRRQVDEIDRSAMHPIRKARKLLLIARRIRKSVRKFAQGVSILANDCMDEEAERMKTAMQRMRDLGNEVRERARNLLSHAREA